jgi:hypothetical protein
MRMTTLKEARDAVRSAAEKYGDSWATAVADKTEHTREAHRQGQADWHAFEEALDAFAVAVQGDVFAQMDAVRLG